MESNPLFPSFKGKCSNCSKEIDEKEFEIYYTNNLHRFEYNYLCCLCWENKTEEWIAINQLNYLMFNQSKKRRKRRHIKYNNLMNSVYFSKIRNIKKDALSKREKIKYDYNEERNKFFDSLDPIFPPLKIDLNK
jgi:hypothetical protein